MSIRSAPAVLSRSREGSGMQEIRTIGVVGAGTMGHGIAQVSAASGYDVVLVDVAPQALERGITQIGQSLQKLESKGKLSAEEREKTIARIRPESRPDALRAAALVVEAAVGRLGGQEGGRGEARASTVARIRPGSRLGALRDADLVVEAVVERLEVKQGVLAELDRACPAHGILATNTSSPPLP